MKLAKAFLGLSGMAVAAAVVAPLFDSMLREPALSPATVQAICEDLCLPEGCILKVTVEEPEDDP